MELFALWWQLWRSHVGDGSITDERRLGPESPWRRLTSEHLIRLESELEVSLKFTLLNNKAVLVIDIDDTYSDQYNCQYNPADWEKQMNEYCSFLSQPPIPIHLLSSPKRILNNYWEFSFLCFFIQYDLIPKSITLPLSIRSPLLFEKQINLWLNPIS